MQKRFFFALLAAFLLTTVSRLVQAQTTPGYGVGIGTAAPEATLHVAAASSTVRLECLVSNGVRVLTTDATGDVGTQAQPTLDVSDQTLTSGGVTLSTNIGATGRQGP